MLPRDSNTITVQDYNAASAAYPRSGTRGAVRFAKRRRPDSDKDRSLGSSIAMSAPCPLPTPKTLARIVRTSAEADLQSPDRLGLKCTGYRPFSGL